MSSVKLGQGEIKHQFLERDIAVAALSERAGFLAAQASLRRHVLFFFGYTFSISNATLMLPLRG